MFCPNCGGQNDRNVANCAHCGHAFAPQAPPPQAPQAPQGYGAPPQAQGYGAPQGYGYPPQQQSGFFSFKELLAPSKISIVWLIGSIAIATWTLLAFFNNLLSISPGFLGIGGAIRVTAHGVMSAFMALIVGFIGLILYRLACELMVILSKKD